MAAEDGLQLVVAPKSSSMSTYFPTQFQKPRGLEHYEALCCNHYDAENITGVDLKVSILDVNIDFISIL
jgi:hypothetical protein